MSGLTAFFKQNALAVENVRYVASNRYLDGKGKPMEWEIKAIDSEVDEALRRSCMKQVQVPGKKNQFTQDFDYNQYIGKLAAACTVFPDLNNKELQDSYGVLGAEKLLKLMLTPGEFAEYANQVQEINGHDTTMQELVDEAKN